MAAEQPCTYRGEKQCFSWGFMPTPESLLRAMILSLQQPMSRRRWGNLSLGGEGQRGNTPSTP